MGSRGSCSGLLTVCSRLSNTVGAPAYAERRILEAGPDVTRAEPRGTPISRSDRHTGDPPPAARLRDIVCARLAPEELAAVDVRCANVQLAGVAHLGPLRDPDVADIENERKASTEADAARVSGRIRIAYAT